MDSFSQEQKPRILIIEDDIAIQEFLKNALENDGYEVSQAYDGKSGLELFREGNYILILLDLGLPDLDGNDIIGKVRTYSQIPIIVLSARSQEEDKIRALDLGASDYLTKPFSVNELRARIRASIRNHQPEIKEKTYQADTFEVDFTRMQVKDRKGEPIHLTELEMKILLFFIRNKGMLLTHRQILQAVWGYADESNELSLRVYVRKLRKKLGTKQIQTEVGVGYRFVDS